MIRIFLTHTTAMFENYYGEAAHSELAKIGIVTRNPTEEPLDADGLIRYAADAHIVVSDRQTPGFGAFFDAAPDLAAFVRCAVDIRNVDVPAASRNGILCTQATPGFMDAVCEHALAMMIDLSKGITDAVIDYRQGRQPAARMGRQLKGSTAGIIGYGAIGVQLAVLTRALGMSTLVHDPHKTISEPGVEQTGLRDLLARSDYVVCLAVAVPETENLMNAAAFAAMKPSAYFINLARGNLVDEAALEDALEKRTIAGAALDVGRAPDQMPSPRLARRPDVIATPHIAALTPPSILHQANDTVRQVRAIAQGTVPDGAVNAPSATRVARLRPA